MDKNTGREEVKALLAGIYKKYPAARSNMFNAIKNIDRVSLLAEEGE